MKRICHHYERWEDYQFGMYQIDSKFDSTSIIDQSKTLLSDVEKLYCAMSEVTNSWKFSSEQNLTDKSRNRRAWLGQAACCKSCNAKEGLTKRAWHLLSSTQQDEANFVADKVIREWEINYLEKQRLLFNNA